MNPMMRKALKLKLKTTIMKIKNVLIIHKKVIMLIAFFQG
jgi:hypothetical protein